MSTTLGRKARRDLGRRRARSVLTIVTIALSVGGAGMLAVPSLLDRTMNAEVRDTRLYDVILPVRDLPFADDDARELAAIPNVAAVSARASFSTRVLIGDRRLPATVWGVTDFADQPVDAVRVTGGSEPGAGQVLTDRANAARIDVSLAAGDQVELLRADGSTTPLRVTGSARSLVFSQTPWIYPKQVVLYAANDTVRSLAGATGVNRLEIRLDDDSSAAVDRTVVDLRTWLDRKAGPGALSDLPMTRTAGDWPGREDTQQLSSFVYVLAAIALVTAVFLIANTMNTLVAEQTGEIGIMKAIGGRRRQIAGIFLRAALYLAVTGVIVGIPLGVLLASAIAGFITQSVLGVPGRFGVSLPVVAASATVAVLLTVVASAPALRRALRLPVRQALQGQNAASMFGASRFDRLLLHDRLLPRMAKFGARNLLRNKRRSAATTAQVALAVATALGLLNMAIAFTRTLDDSYAILAWDASVYAPPAAPPLDADARRIAAEAPGVAQVEPVLQNVVEYNGEPFTTWGFTDTPLYRPDLRSGRWYSAEEARNGAAVAVAGANLARERSLEPGDTITLRTAGGDVAVDVIGVDSGQMENGMSFFVPLRWLQTTTGWGDTTNLLWLSITDRTNQAADRVSNTVEDTLDAAGYRVAADKLYARKADNKAANDTILNMIIVVGGVIVAISMVGLVSSITMSVLERTREIGILRCVGARARDIRHAYTAEGVTQAALGWLVGLPFGYLLSRLLKQLSLTIMEIEIPSVFDVTIALVVLAATIALAALVVLGPVRRATRINPGDAIRYV